MNIKRKKRLLEDLKDRKYRNAYVSSSIDVGVAFQIRALRKSQPWTQVELAEKANIKQPRVHELEDPSNTPTLSTLKKLANAFDVGLVVRFVPISDLVKWDDNISESLNVPSYDNDIYFKTEEHTTEETVADDTRYHLVQNVRSMEEYLLTKHSLGTDDKVTLQRAAHL